MSGHGYDPINHRTLRSTPPPLYGSLFTRTTPISLPASLKLVKFIFLVCFVNSLLPYLYVFTGPYETVRPVTTCTWTTDRTRGKRFTPANHFACFYSWNFELNTYLRIDSHEKFAVSQHFYPTYVCGCVFYSNILVVSTYEIFLTKLSFRIRFHVFLKTRFFNKMQFL